MLALANDALSAIGILTLLLPQSDFLSFPMRVLPFKQVPLQLKVSHPHQNIPIPCMDIFF